MGQRAELEVQNIVYKPMVWTHFGRPHEAAVDCIRSIAKLVARKRGGVKTSVIVRKINAAISVCLARRAALMSLACWPRASREGTADVAAIIAMDRFEEDDSTSYGMVAEPEDTDEPIPTATDPSHLAAHG